MDYNCIDKFLDKFKKLLCQSEAVYKIITEIINKHIKIEVKERDIKIQNTIIYIKGSPTFKNEILIHKQGILIDLKDLLSDRNFTDIR